VSKSLQVTVPAWQCASDELYVCGFGRDAGSSAQWSHWRYQGVSHGGNSSHSHHWRQQGSVTYLLIYCCCCCWSFIVDLHSNRCY